MKHYLLNVTWRCQNHCAYCWMHKTVGRRDDQMEATERSAKDWAAALIRDEVELADIAGGEPLLVDWLPELMATCPNTQFGLSTNAVSLDALRRLIEPKPPNLLSVNVSLQSRSQNYRVVFDLLRGAGLNCFGSIVDAIGNVGRLHQVADDLCSAGIAVIVTPEEPVETLALKRPQGLVCEAGTAHLTIAPDGSAWPCLTALRSPYYASTYLGNWLDGEVNRWACEQPCYLDCADYYILAGRHPSGDVWGVKARPA